MWKQKTEKRKTQTNIVIEKEIEGYLGYFHQESCCKYFCLLGKGGKKNKEENRIKKREERKKWKKKEIQIFQFWESFKIWNLSTQTINRKIPEEKRN